ncbi:hypothetical protein ACFWVP_01150 [Streptomyces sp. NPDC058637]|uniref:hypothetical protein n=1 Tax=Streptomyces sp. NPDC058637 TaxID=3346569 RepID=UPI003647FE64
MTESGFTLKIGADAGSSFTVMFEPSGMPYELGPSETMSAHVEEADPEEPEIVYRDGGISI